jgi:hypothetical protein
MMGPKRRARRSFMVGPNRRARWLTWRLALGVWRSTACSLVGPGRLRPGSGREAQMVWSRGLGRQDLGTLVLILVGVGRVGVALQRW